ncbi:MAG: hypothetical protein K6G60_09630 [Lachnospiraceae bacterium]|nr:hypothetical protein [Lachnospiraceae bacterium]
MDIIKKNAVSQPRKPYSYIYWVQRGMILFSTILLFLPSFFPARIALSLVIFFKEMIKKCNAYGYDQCLAWSREEAKAKFANQIK